MNKELLYSLLLLLICIIYVVFTLPKSEPINTQNEQEFKEQINAIEHKIDSLGSVRGEIETKIDTVYQQIEKVKTIKDEKLISITYNDPDADYEFFTNYIDENRNRLDSCINQ